MRRAGSALSGWRPKPRNAGARHADEQASMHAACTYTTPASAVATQLQGRRNVSHKDLVAVLGMSD